jgi:hypothetical protein
MRSVVVICMMVCLGCGPRVLYYVPADTSTGALKTLTPEQAKDLVKASRGLDLSGLKTIDDETAEVLSHHELPLNLNSLVKLTDGQAAALAKIKGHLFLDGLTTVSDKQAEALSQHKGGYLLLNGLTALSDTAADALSHHKGGLELDGLKTLTDN